MPSNDGAFVGDNGFTASNSRSNDSVPRRMESVMGLTTLLLIASSAESTAMKL